MIVWLWEAGSACGVSGERGAACRAAASAMAAADAASATVEEAVHLDGGGWLTAGYLRTGRYWVARRHGGRVRWTACRREMAS